jgi:hypothetical protein
MTSRADIFFERNNAVMVTAVIKQISLSGSFSSIRNPFIFAADTEAETIAGASQFEMAAKELILIMSRRRILFSFIKNHIEKNDRSLKVIE